MKVHIFQSETWLPLPPEELFPFFADAGNLERITPPWLHFKVLTPTPVSMREGSIIDYKLRVRGLPLRWRTRIKVWEPPHRFVDEQLHGPYRQWIHEHTFEPRNGGTICRDMIRYAVPMDFPMHRWFVRPDIERIFQFRAHALQSKFVSA